MVDISGAIPLGEFYPTFSNFGKISLPASKYTSAVYWISVICQMGLKDNDTSTGWYAYRVILFQH
jgi:hypothetical protein